MFNATHSRFNWRTPNAILFMAASICAAGLAIGAISGGRLLAQLTGGNPTPATENSNICKNLTTCSAADKDCIPIPTSLLPTSTPTNSTDNGWIDNGGNCGVKDCPFPFEFLKCPCGPPLAAGACPIP